MKCSNYGLTIVVGLMLAACGSNDTPSPRGKLVEAPVVKGTKMRVAELDTLTQNSGLQALTGTAKCDVTVAQIKYQTPGAKSGEMSNASAAILIPSGDNCPGPYPLIAYARGTTFPKTPSLADPSNKTTMQLMAFYAAQGYAVVASDFLGYALSDYPFHPYLHADSEASAIVDSIRATRNAASSLGLLLNGKVMVAGYSQGGHAAMAAQRAIERDNAGEINLVAAAHLAGPYNVSGTLMDGVDNQVDAPQFLSAFQISSWQKVYGNVYDSASNVYLAKYAGYIGDLLPTDLDTSKFVTDGTIPYGKLDSLFTTTFLAELKDRGSINTNGERVRNAATAQNVFQGWDPKAPVTLCGGSGDPLVKFSINGQLAYNTFKSRGLNNVTIVDVDGVINDRYGPGRPSYNNATYLNNYHGLYEPPLCTAESRKLFDQYK